VYSTNYTPVVIVAVVVLCIL